MARTMSIRDIENLRKLRTRAPKDLSVAGEITALARQFRSASNKAASVQEQWGSLLPANLRDSHRQVRFTRGMLTITAKSNPAAAALQQWLANGGESLTRSKIPGVRVVKISTR